MTVLPGLPATFTTATALAAGVHPRVLYGWRDDGEIVELSRGVFRKVDAALASHPDFLAVALSRAAGDRVLPFCGVRARSDGRDSERGADRGTDAQSPAQD